MIAFSPRMQSFYNYLYANLRSNQIDYNSGGESPCNLFSNSELIINILSLFPWQLFRHFKYSLQGFYFHKVEFVSISSVFKRYRENSTAFSQDLMHYVEYSRVDVYWTRTFWLLYVSFGTYPPYVHQVHFLPSSLASILHASFSNHGLRPHHIKTSVAVR